MSHRRRFGLRLGAMLGAGAVAALGLAPYGIWPATLVGVAFAFWGYGRAQTTRQAALTGWAFGTGYFALALIWIVEPFFVQPEVHGWMAPFALLFMSAGLALFWAAAFGAAQRLARGGGIALIGLWALAELARAYVLSGFPWAGLAQIWVGVGPDQALAWIGPHGLGLLTLLAGLCLWRILHPSTALQTRLKAGGVACLLVGGALVAQARPGAVEITASTIRLVQPNAPQDQKWHPDHAWRFFDRQLRFSAEAPAPDLILWPETSIPAWLSHADPLLAEIGQAAGDTPVLAGIQRAEGRRIYNAAILIEDDTITQIYDKHHLVPFGEYIPLGNLAARFGLTGFATRDGQGFSAGPGARLLDLGPLGRALPLICYEVVFPQHAQSNEGRATVLIQLTNDAWFGQHSGPYQHLAQARMRAIEQGLPLLRAANTGVSAGIDPYGRILAQIPLGEPGFVDVALSEPLEKTLYARSGDWLAALVILLTLGFGLRHGWRRAAA